MIVPMFPLPRMFLFPGMLVPLHVFEPRYRQMVEDLLDSTGRLVLANICEDTHLAHASAPPVHDVAGLGEMVHYERMEDDRFLITVAGVGRVRLDEVAAETPYRMADVEPIEETDVPDLREHDLRRGVLDCLEDRIEVSDEIETLSLPRLADLLLVHLDLAPDDMQRLFATENVVIRIENTLAAAVAEHATKANEINDGSEIDSTSTTISEPEPDDHPEHDSPDERG